MGSRYMDYPSPRGVHVPQTYTDDDDPYRRDSAVSPRRNRYSRSVHQTPRTRDVTWISTPDLTPPTPQAPSSPWLPPAQVSSTPAQRPPSAVPPSPAPTVGEHMTVDDFVLMPDEFMDAYRPQRQGSSGGLMKSLWGRLKKLSGFQSMPMPTPYVPTAGSYESQAVEVPAPMLSVPSDGTQSQYVDPTPPETDEQPGGTPYASPYARPAHLRATPASIPRSLRTSPVPEPMPSPVVDIPPPITVVSPSIPPSPIPGSVRLVRRSTPRTPRTPQNDLMPEPIAPLPAEEGSQTLHEPVFSEPMRPVPSPALLAPPVDDPKLLTANKSLAFDVPSTSRGSGSLVSTLTRFKRFVAGLDGMPWVSDAQIADEYIPEMTSRSRLRRRVRQGTEPSWYNPRPEMEERPEYWSQWDMWAKQSTAALWAVGERDMAGWHRAAGPGVPGQWGMPVYPHGYMPAPPGGFVYPSGYPPPGIVTNDAPVIP